MVNADKSSRYAVVLTLDQAAELRELVVSGAASPAIARRARIILASAIGESAAAIAARLRVTSQTIYQWRRAWTEKGMAGLLHETRAGRPVIHGEAALIRIRETLTHRPPEGTGYWTVRSIAAATGVSRSTVSRLLIKARIDPRPRQRAGDYTVVATSR